MDYHRLHRLLSTYKPGDQETFVIQRELVPGEPNLGVMTDEITLVAEEFELVEELTVHFGDADDFSSGIAHATH